MSDKPLHSDNRTTLTVDEMIDLKNQIIYFVRYILTELRTIVRDKKDIMFMYSLARAVVQIESIFKLYELKHLSDCLILYRTQVERLLTLYHLIDTDTIQEFDDWTFIQIFDIRNKAKSDREQNEHLNPKFWTENNQRIEKYQKLKKKGANWVRPNSKELEEISKRHGIHELFKYGYRGASGYVHPMANDGEEEFGLVINMKPKNHVELDTRPIINNSLVVFIFIVNFALDEMDFEWNEYVFKFFTACTDSIKNGTQEYMEFKKIIDGFIKNDIKIYKKYSS